MSRNLGVIVNGDTIYADADVQRQLARWLTDARANGFSRRQLAEETKLTPTALWRIERGNAHAGEVRAVTRAVERIAQAKLRPARPRRLSCGEAQRRLRAVEHLLDDASGLRVAELRAAVVEALTLIRKREI